MDKKNVIIQYLRISSEDDFSSLLGQIESQSISHQRLIISEYIKNHEDLRDCDLIELVDDGYTGTNFDRPGIKKALNLLRNGEADRIIVKDFSRFGRNYIEVCNYLEQVFPFMGIRFISVNDGYDSINPDCIGSMITVFKAIFADIYSKDISVKIKSALVQKAKQGKYLSSSAPYGYIKTKSQLNTLQIDYDAAEIIRYIFYSYADGKSKNQIARDLNAQGILTPMQHKKLQGHIQGWERMGKGDKCLWVDSMIWKILKDQRYIGNVVYGKTSRRRAGNRDYINVQEDNWIVVEDVHEPIISKELFARVQSLISQPFTRKFTDSKPLFDKKVHCAVCGKRLVLSRSKEPYYYCQTHRYTDDFLCKKLNITASNVYNSALSSVRLQAALALNAKKLMSIKHQERQAEIKEKQTKIKAYQREVQRLEVYKKELFQSFFNGELKKESFKKQNDLYTSKRMELLKELNVLFEEVKTFDSLKFDEGIAVSLNSCLLIRELTDDIVDKLIQTIKVYDENTIEVVWKFRDIL